MRWHRRDNNVFGQGRLDALALLNAAPIGDTGTLSGTVTAATGGAALAGASVTVKAEGQPDKTLTTSSNGSFSSVLPAGDYGLTVASFGYATQTATATITTGQTTTKNFALVSTPQVSVGGTVTDGSGHGWPLYAKVTVEGPGGVFDYTTPSNGRYSLKVPSGAAYSLKVESKYPGYQTVSQPITVGTGNLTQNVAVPVRRHFVQHRARLQVGLGRRVRDLRLRCRAERVDRRRQQGQRPGLEVRRPGQPGQPGRRQRQVRDHRQ